MRKTLRVILGLQILLGAVWFAGALRTGTQSQAVLGLFVGTYWMHLLALPFALWALWRHPADRPTALVMIGLPVALLFLPGLIVDMTGGPWGAIQIRNLMVGLSLALLVIVLVVPARVAEFLPDVLFQSKALNVTILVTLVLGWLLPLVALLLLLFSASDTTGPADTDAPAWIVGYFILFGGIYGALFVLMSLGSTLFAYIGLRTRGPNRKLHIGQIAVALPAVVAFGWLAATLFRLTGQY